jgi:hypothetical protein
MPPKPWIDLVSCALPRATAKVGLGSLLDCWEDRDDFRVRLVYHLDELREDLIGTYPNEIVASTAQAVEIGNRCNDFLFVTKNWNVGYGGSILSCLRVVRNRVFWCEDDKKWLRKFSLMRALAMPQTGIEFVYWIGRNTPKRLIQCGFNPFDAGATSPGLWPVGAPRYLLDRFPPIPEHMTERATTAIMRGPFKSLLYDTGPLSYWKDIGRGRGKSPAATKYRDRETGTVIKVRTDKQALKACGYDFL